MPDHDHLGALTQLPQVASADERRALFRQAMATLSRAALEQQPVPLEGVDPEKLLAAVRIASRDGLFADLQWLSPPAAAAAIYELAAAIPMGVERRQLGRQAATQLQEGSARTFAVLATALAAESKKALGTPAIRARIALTLSLPTGLDVAADPLALTLLSRPDLCREWLTEPARGSLPARRLAARLIERAAREAARRGSQGDRGVLRPFSEPEVLAAMRALLRDREPLVYRHVAIARGVLAQADPGLHAEIEAGLDPALTPTEWRRAAVSLAASLAHRPEALARCNALLDGELVRRDPGLAAAMIHGLPTAAESEPDAAEALIERVMRMSGILGAEALVEIRRERIGQLGTQTAYFARERLEQWLNAQPEDDDGHVALCEALVDELAPLTMREPTLRDELENALTAFVDKDPMQAVQIAERVCVSAHALLGELELSVDSDRAGRRLGFRALRELDQALLHDRVLCDLLAVGSGLKLPVPTTKLEGIYDRLAHWLDGSERAALSAAPLLHATLRMQRMRSLLHLVDHGLVTAREESPRSDEAAPSVALVLTKRLLLRAAHDAPSSLRRVGLASLARGLDALVREEGFELSDVLVAGGDCAKRAELQQVLAEASMNPDLHRSFAAYAELSAVTEAGPPTGRGTRAALDALDSFAQSLPTASTLRVAALRGCMRELTDRLEAACALSSLSEAAQSEPSPIARLAQTLHTLAQLTKSARRRLPIEPAPPSLTSSGAIAVLQATIERGVRGEDTDLQEALTELRDALELELPRSIAIAVYFALDRLRKLPRYRATGAHDSFAPPPPLDPPLPQWVPARRILGEFYLLRALRSGPLASVFIAVRARERQLPSAERFALKTPDYSATNARALSESVFIETFRAESRALLELPQHPNLANVVHVDAELKPKPILVMELVSGASVSRWLERKDLTLAFALRLVLGVADGLAHLHRHGLAHLDVNPSNVLVRMGTTAGQSSSTPVLVDYGLAGRHLRHGCGRVSYGAPELWSVEAAASATDARPADVYALCCLAFELLTSVPLFDGPSERAIIAAHLAHDGEPPLLVALRQEPQLAPLCQWLASGLRQRPDERISVEQLRAGLAEVAPAIGALPWPLHSSFAAVSGVRSAVALPETAPTRSRHG